MGSVFNVTDSFLSENCKIGQKSRGTHRVESKEQEETNRNDLAGWDHVLNLAWGEKAQSWFGVGGSAAWKDFLAKQSLPPGMSGQPPEFSTCRSLSLVTSFTLSPSSAPVVPSSIHSHRLRQQRWAQRVGGNLPQAPARDS